jgi:hypothetical protein
MLLPPKHGLSVAKHGATTLTYLPATKRISMVVHGKLQKPTAEITPSIIIYTVGCTLSGIGKFYARHLGMYLPLLIFVLWIKI